MTGPDFSTLSIHLVLAGFLLGCGPAMQGEPVSAPIDAGRPLARHFDSSGQYSIKSGSESVVIPFEMYRGDIRMEVTVNGQPCHFLVDNGSLWDELLFFGSPKVDRLGLEITGERTLGNGTGANPNIMDVAAGVAVDFGGIEFTEQPALIMKYIPGLPNPWEGADGQISAGFFKNFVVGIDFDEMELTLTKPSDCTRPGDGYVASMKPGPFDTRMMEVEVETVPGNATILDLLIDLGGIHALYLPLGRYDTITLPAGAQEQVLGVGYGVPEMGYIGPVSRVRIGPYEMRNVRTAFKDISGAGDDFGSAMIGMPFLQEFNITFNYFCDTLTLKPNRSFRGSQLK